MRPRVLKWHSSVKLKIHFLLQVNLDSILCSGKVILDTRTFNGGGGGGYLVKHNYSLVLKRRMFTSDLCRVVNNTLRRTTKSAIFMAE